jgi:hypothetical protein
LFLGCGLPKPGNRSQELGTSCDRHNAKFSV